MANKYAGTQTEKNLEAAFAGKSHARNKFTYFASKRRLNTFCTVLVILSLSFSETRCNDSLYTTAEIKPPVRSSKMSKNT